MTDVPHEETDEERSLREQMEAMAAQQAAADGVDTPPIAPTPETVAEVVERIKALVGLSVTQAPADELVFDMPPEDVDVLVAAGYADELSLGRTEVEVRRFLRDERGYSTPKADRFKLTAIKEKVRTLNQQFRPRGRPGAARPTPTPRANGHDASSPFLAPGAYSPAALIAALSSKCVIARLGAKSTVVEKLPGDELRYFTFKEFEDHYADVRVVVPMPPRPPMEKGGPRWWIESGQARTYRQGVDCVPRKHLNKHTLNTWRGFGPRLAGFSGYDLPDDLKALLADGKGGRGSITMPRPKGSWRKFRRMVLDVICNGDVKLYEYTISWLANMVQHPDQPGQTFLVLQGEEGIGKGIFGDMFTALMGKMHGFYISNSEALTGDYNDHLQDKVALFADEAVFSGSHKTDNILKSLVTQDVISVHRKFYSRYMVRNLLHIVIATNSDWAIKVSATSRRPVVYKANSSRINDTDYFGAIKRQMHEQGGLECMLFDLLTRDLSEYNPRKNYRTAAMAEQREFSWQPHERWLEEILERGYVWQPKFDHPEFEAWRNVVPRTLLHASYEAFYKGMARKDGAIYSQRKLTEWLFSLGFGEGKASRTDPLFERPAESGGSRVVTCGADNRRGIDLGAQADARRVFDAKVRTVEPSVELWASDVRSTAERPVEDDGQTAMDVREPARPVPPDDAYDGEPE